MRLRDIERMWNKEARDFLGLNETKVYSFRMTIGPELLDSGYVSEVRNHMLSMLKNRAELDNLGLAEAHFTVRRVDDEHDPLCGQIILNLSAVVVDRSPVIDCPAYDQGACEIYKYFEKERGN